MAEGIKEPHAHDVLSGRGNFVNYHDGNEYFRKLVRKHKLEYVNCPKQQKGKFSKLIVDEIKARNPPGRFLKQDKDSKLWFDIGEKKALDKTRQALREGAPELMNNGKTSSKEETTASDNTQSFNKSITIENQHSMGEFSILQQSLMSLGGDANASFNPNQSNMSMNQSMQNPFNVPGIGLSPNMLASPMYGSPEKSIRNSMVNRSGGMNLSQIIPPPQVHQNDLQQQRKEQEEQLQQLRYLQQQQQQQQQRQQQQQQQHNQHHQQQQHQQHQQQQSRQQNHFTSQQEQEILRNATAVMGNDYQKQQHQQQQPTKMQMDQLRINRLKEKRKMLEQQILQQRQLEIMELKKLQNQQRSEGYDQNQPQHISSSMRGSHQSRMGEMYGDSFLEPTPLSGGMPNQIRPPDETAVLSGGDGHSNNRRSGLVRENSLEMDSVFNNNAAGGAPPPNNTNPKKNYNNSVSGMSMSATSLSLGFDEEGQLSAMFDTSMKFDGGYATSLNDAGGRSPKPRHNKGGSGGGNAGGNPGIFGMSVASIGANKSNSSMSCDSNLSRLFDDTGTSSK